MLDSTLYINSTTYIVSILIRFLSTSIIRLFWFDWTHHSTSMEISVRDYGTTLLKMLYMHKLQWILNVDTTFIFYTRFWGDPACSIHNNKTFSSTCGSDFPLIVSSIFQIDPSHVPSLILTFIWKKKNIKSRSPKDVLCQDWLILAQWFWRRLRQRKQFCLSG